jgi:hypothetical protein
MDDNAPCVICGRPSTHLCDYKIGAPIGGYVREGRVDQNRFRAVMDAKRPMFSCDAPLCEDHATNAGIIHASGKDGFTMTVDYCPIHAAVKHAKVLPISDDEAEKIRRDITASFMRQKLAVV